MCYFLKVCPVPMLLRCRDEGWRSRRASHIKYKKEEKEFVSEQEEATFWCLRKNNMLPYCCCK